MSFLFLKRADSYVETIEALITVDRNTRTLGELWWYFFLVVKIDFNFLILFVHYPLNISIYLFGG